MSLSLKDRDFNSKLLASFKNGKLTPDELLKEIKEYYNKFLNKRTRSVKFSVAKKFFKENKVPVKVYANIGPGKEITAEIKEEANEELSSRKVVKVNVNEINEFIRKYLNTSNTSIVSCGILLLLYTGRRMNEVIFGSFRSAKDKNKLLFKGILKKRGKNIGEVEIMTLVDSFDVLQIYSNFVRMKQNTNLDALSQRIRYELKYYSNKSFNSSHKLRVIYANYLYLYKNPGSIIYNSFINKVLNHSNMMTSINYSTVMVTK
jgi:integrase